MQLGVSAYGWGHVAKFRKFALTMQKQTGPAQGVWQSKLWVLDIVAMNDTFLRRTTNTPSGSHDWPITLNSGAECSGGEPAADAAD